MKDLAGEIIEIHARLNTQERQIQLIIGFMDAVQGKFDQILVALNEINCLVNANAGMTAKICEALLEAESSDGETVN